MSRTQIFASTACMASGFSSLRDLLTAYAKAGIDAVELGWSPPIGDLALPHGLSGFPAKWLVHNYFPAPAEPFVLNLASQVESNLRRSRQLASAAIQLSAKLGAPFYSVHCGFLAEFEPRTLGGKLHYAKICDRETGYRTFVDSLHLLLEEALAAGVKLLIEPNVVAPFNLVDGRNPVLMMAEPAEFIRLFDEVRHVNLGVLLDIGHLNVTATTLGFQREHFIESVESKIAAFHLHDNDGTADQHRPATKDGWAWQLIKTPKFRGCPVVVEAKFSSEQLLVEHCLQLESALNS